MKARTKEGPADVGASHGAQDKEFSKGYHTQSTASRQSRQEDRLKSSAIRVQDGKLILSNGRGRTRLVLSWPYGHDTSVLPKGRGRT
ncbi:hypothetical protein [Alicyclobacillus macrosporangiidus]|uniref:hypothetical protein n=1 Tax=Alicyclobacillus macrosporangiidus TaxID=392015 RepID=UPI000497177A|nr:hypothetical protein [Alicyclobacillus macrosporangiidus]